MQIKEFFDEKMLILARKIIKFQNIKPKNNNHSDITQPAFIINIDLITKIEEKYALKILSLIFQEISLRDYKPRLNNLKKFFEDIKNNLIRDFYGCNVANFESSQDNIIVTKKEAMTGDIFYFRTILKNL